MPTSARRARGTSRPARRAAALVAAALALAAAPAGAQFAGVPPAPPRRAAPPPTVAATRPGADSLTRLQRERDSLATVQRLDIQAWVDSAAPALARRPATSTDSLRRPTSTDSLRRPTSTPPARRPEPPAERTTASVADRRGAWYLRPWPCQATYTAVPSRSV